tara:strand:+ start:1142 stop:1828 length:687 start_codon:yes stop_codon:yes gene_type:complete
MNVLIADDHSLMRDILRQYTMLLDENTQIFEASSLEEVRSHAASMSPDLVLLDLDMPGMDGTKSIAEVTAIYPEARLAVISATIDGDTISSAFRNGAHGYIPKTMRAKSLVNALRLILNGETYVPPAIMDFVSEDTQTALPGNEPATNIPPELSKLTTREVMVLLRLIEGKSNKEIAIDLGLQEVTVKVHLRNVFRKLKANNRTDAVRIALLAGDPSTWNLRTPHKTT